MSNYVLDPITEMAVRLDIATVPAAYSTTEGEFLLLDVRGMNDKAILIKNTGAAALDYKIDASIDDTQNKDDAEFDIVQTAESSLTAANQVFIQFDNYYRYLRIQFKTAGATSVTIKATATGN